MLFSGQREMSRLESVWGACMLFVIPFLFYCILLSFIVAGIINVYSLLSHPRT
jgi:hypothetical protein